MPGGDDFDDLLSTLGFGRWQIPSLMVTILAMSQFSIHLIGSPLLAGPLPFHCSTVPPKSFRNNSSARLSGYHDQCLPLPNNSLPSTMSTVNGNASTVLTSNITSTTATEAATAHSAWHITNLQSCPIVQYDTSVFTSTVISEWHLVCERSALRPLFQTVFTVGGMVGSTAGGHIADRWGRRRAVMGGCVANVAVVVAMVLTPFYSLLIALRFVAGCSVMVMLVPAWSLTLESTPAGCRSRVGMLLGLPFSASTMGFAGVGFMIRDWRALLLVCSSPILILLPVSLMTDESARWLVQRGQLQEASRVLQKAFRQNKVQLHAPIAAAMEQLIKKSHESPTSGSAPLLAEFRKVRAYLIAPAMRTIILVTPILWFLHSCLYLGVVINANNFTSTDPFLYLALSGVMEALAILLITPLTAYLGRRLMVWAGLGLGGALLILQLLVTEESGLYWLQWLLVMVAFLLVAGAFQVNYVYAPELFPTEARARGFAFVSVMGSVGFSCAPLVTHVLADYAWWAVNVTFGAAGILGSLLVPLLPETNKRPLPETLQDVENRRKYAHARRKLARHSPQDAGGDHTNLTPLLETASGGTNTPESPYHHVSDHYTSAHIHQALQPQPNAQEIVSPDQLKNHLTEALPTPQGRNAFPATPLIHFSPTALVVPSSPTAHVLPSPTKTPVVPSPRTPAASPSPTTLVASSSTTPVASSSTTPVASSSTTPVASSSSTTPIASSSTTPVASSSTT